ncbi:alkaline phosphatase family protein [Enterovibrio nigricans]|uniref:Type I phosphodiesterase / nucleotide pyrophosphatase n=1 Tax=Enterovibrio nigricans DSM 22720 TaxID=1121868 RepID=A0A1T4VPU7_9GAMM|nr:alkaline phosphatase family protein [Enterovibrio nigricans]SKA66986.1 Type I phosphodiesterase / nucleotide pyrophosphatase [Enterovibrio nigricans DSM 22720]
MEFSAATTRDATLFTVGGVTLDALVLTLPLDVDVKARVIAQLSNPVYAIQLGHLLYSFYDKYTGEIVNEDIFKGYLLDTFSEPELKNWQHTLFTLEQGEGDGSKETATQADIINRQFIAMLVTLYDALFGKDKLLYGSDLPEQYRYLTDSPSDRETVSTVQHILIEMLTQYSASLEGGDIKSAILRVIEDGKPEHLEKENNQAQAITISLIDFVRLNVLKGYRQFLLEKAKSKAVDDWMIRTLKNNPNALIEYLDHQNQRPMAVQVVVDGLQQALMQGLVSKTPSPFLQQVKIDELNATNFAPQHVEITTPNVVPDNRFLYQIAETPFDDTRYLPFFRQLYQHDRNGVVEYGVSTTPTISVRNLPIVKTGANVAGEGGTGIPNFHFVDRKQDRAYYFFGNDALQLDPLFDGNGAKTQFERLVPMVTLNCNAQYDWYAQSSYDPLLNLGLGEAIRDFGEQRCLNDLERRGHEEISLRKERKKLVDDIKRYQSISIWSPLTRYTKRLAVEDHIQLYAEKSQKGLPDFVLAYNPWADHFAHFTGPFADEILAPTGELNRLDYWLGRMENVYREAGVYDQVLWGMAGDHGLTPIHYIVSPEREIFDGIDADYGISPIIRKISSDEGEGPKITHAFRYPSNRGVDIIVASTAGGNYMMDLFNSSRGWATQPLFHELTYWKSLSSATDEPGIDIVHETVKRLGESLDYLVVRETDCNTEKCIVRLVGERDGKRVDEFIERKGSYSRYYAKDGKQPVLLDLYAQNPYASQQSDAQKMQKAALINQCMVPASNSLPETWCNEDTWRQLTRLTPRPDSINQLAHLYDEDRAGTINLFPAQGIGYNTKVPGRHAGEHFHEKDAFIGFWGTAVNADSRIGSAVNGSLSPTLYEYLTNKPVVVGQDGWGFPSLLNQLQTSDNHPSDNQSP